MSNTAWTPERRAAQAKRMRKIGLARKGQGYSDAQRLGAIRSHFAKLPPEEQRRIVRELLEALAC